jgi:hypothetical protein
MKKSQLYLCKLSRWLASFLITSMERQTTARGYGNTISDGVCSLVSAENHWELFCVKVLPLLKPPVANGADAPHTRVQGLSPPGCGLHLVTDRQSSSERKTH